MSNLNIPLKNQNKNILDFIKFTYMSCYFKTKNNNYHNRDDMWTARETNFIETMYLFYNKLNQINNKLCIYNEQEDILQFFSLDSLNINYITLLFPSLYQYLLYLPGFQPYSIKQCRTVYESHGYITMLFFDYIKLFALYQNENKKININYIKNGIFSNKNAFLDDIFLFDEEEYIYFQNGIFNITQNTISIFEKDRFLFIKKDKNKLTIKEKVPKEPDEAITISDDEKIIFRFIEKYQQLILSLPKDIANEFCNNLKEYSYIYDLENISEQEVKDIIDLNYSY